MKTRTVWSSPLLQINQCSKP